MKKNILMILICGIMILGLTTGCGEKEPTSNNQQKEQTNNQNNEQVKQESPITKITEKMKKGDFSDIAGTYELAKYDASKYTGDKFEQYNKYGIQKIVIEEKGNIYLNDTGTIIQFSIEEIEENTNWNYIRLKNSYGDMLFIYPANFEYKGDAEIPETWNNNTKNRIGANFTWSTYQGDLYYIQN